MLCKCQRLVFGMWAHRCLWSVYVGEWAARPTGYWYIVSMAAEADIISLSVPPGIDASAFCHRRRNWPFNLFSETFVCARFAWTLSTLSGFYLGILAVNCHSGVTSQVVIIMCSWQCVESREVQYLCKSSGLSLASSLLTVVISSHYTEKTWCVSVKSLTKRRRCHCM